MLARTTTLALLALALSFVSAEADREVSMSKPDFHPLIGGCGGVYFLAEPGELVVEVVKRDRNSRNTTCELQAILVGPDRAVLQQALIPDDGKPVKSGLGPEQVVRLSAQVPSKGIYALNVTVSQDRYGYNMVWGFRTNCPRYLIETARGHKDERHQEPIVLESRDRSGIVCFEPREARFKMDLSGLPKSEDPITVQDANGQLIGSFEPDSHGKVSWEAPADVSRDATPWQLHLPAARGVVNIDGVTRWERGDAAENMCIWSPDPASWFPFIENRWLLTPYQRHMYLEPGDQSEVSLQVHNNASREREFELSLEFPGDVWPVRLSKSRIGLGAHKATTMKVICTMPEEGEMRLCHVRVTPVDAPDVSTYSTIAVHPGQAPCTKPLNMPIELKPYRHENEQFGYLPKYPIQNQVYFDPNNQPFMRSGRGITTWREGQWTETDINARMTNVPDVFKGRSFSVSSTKIAFDSDGWIYMLGYGGRGALLYSADGGQTFSACEIPGANGTMDIDQFSGHNIPDGPPAFVRFRRTSGGGNPRLRWRSVNDLELFLPRKVDGHIEVGEPVVISRSCIGLSAHSGIPSSVVSRGSKVHVTWGAATDPKKEVPGVPQYVVTCDRDTRKLGEPALIGYGPPANDVHNSPSITIDGDGYLHVLLGTHGRPFQYARSLAANDAGKGWTEPVSAGDGLSQTYIGFVCGPDGTLHVVFRLWRHGEPFPHSSHATLAYQRKRPGQPWEAPRILVRAAFSEYSIFYHRLTIDHGGRLFISYDYWSTHWFYRNDHFGTRRALLMSPDGGDSWKLAAQSDLTANVN